MTGFRIDEIEVPLSLDGDAGADFVALIDVQNACAVAAYGTVEMTTTAAEELPHFRDRQARMRIVVARIADRIVGMALHQYRFATSQTGWVDLAVLPEFRGGGIGTALADWAESTARESGQATLTSWTAHPDGPGPRLGPPTGAGEIPADNREVRFLLSRGWTLEQVMRVNRFELSGDAARATGVTEPQRNADDYRVLSWVEATPPEFLDDFAVLITRMSTDAPSGGLDAPEDVWDAARLTDFELDLMASPQQPVVSVALHVPSGRLAGFTRIVAPHDTARPASQWDTLVLAEHRGHRLGMLLKRANMAFLTEMLPGHPSILTFNAEENSFMLAVNEAVGFETIGHEGAWRKNL